MDVFSLRDQVIGDYQRYVRSFLTVRDPKIEQLIDEKLAEGFLWPDPLVQLNPAFEPGESLAALVDDGILHRDCSKVFRRRDSDGADLGPLRPYRHQVEGVRAASAGDNYVLTTGTGSGKSLSYIIPIVDHVLRFGQKNRIHALIVYPMNALANSQRGELEKFLGHAWAGGSKVAFERYTGQDSKMRRREIQENPPHILLTNYVMLELILTRTHEKALVDAMTDLRFLVLDELHTYRGRQGADVALLVRRLREAAGVRDLIHVGTSATLAGGAWEEQQRDVARLASKLFGAKVRPDRVIGEELRRSTPERSFEQAGGKDELRARLTEDRTPTLDDPLASWIESGLGLRYGEGLRRLERREPKTLVEAAAELHETTGVEPRRCLSELQRALLADDGEGSPLFPFRLHQFVSKGESVWASLEPENRRYLTLRKQRYVPRSGKQKVLLPLAFCRECGQDYYVVRRQQGEDGAVLYHPRELQDRHEDDEGRPGFLYLSSRLPWPEDRKAAIEALPEDWLEDRGEDRVVTRARRGDIPMAVSVSTLGVEQPGEQTVHYLKAPFLFCLRCKVAYDPRGRTDFPKLATLGSEGRSTATTILSLAAIRYLLAETSLEQRARKLLTFSDNRQDASLQAGHFNDFVQIVLLRSALWRAVAAADGLRDDALTPAAFEHLGLPIELYAAEPTVEYGRREDTDRALRRVLGYDLYRDLRRGWRITSPNLEQCGRLEIDYLYLKEFCADEPKWLEVPFFRDVSPEEREQLCRILLDHLRRLLAIRVEYLDPMEQERLRSNAFQYLREPWSLEGEELEKSLIALPRPRDKRRGPRRGIERLTYVSEYSRLALYLKRRLRQIDPRPSLKRDDLARLLPKLLEALVTPGLLHREIEPRRDGEVGGYQLNASAMVWRAGDGSAAFHDPIRVPNTPQEGLRPNPFFNELYTSATADLGRLRAREHTAQVTADQRAEREEEFGDGRLPVLYCSPTMELGVDIAELNVVGMRNVPPTPANYAQRSGRAGRGGQPAFVFTYCSAGSPHDQYFFQRPRKMVSGAVKTPRIELANEDLLRAHVHAILLREARLDLGSSLDEVLDVRGDEPTLQVLPEVRHKLEDEGARRRTRERAEAALGDAIGRLPGQEEGSRVDPGVWIDAVLRAAPRSFEAACERWQDLYRSALDQSKEQNRIRLDASRSPRDRRRAEDLRGQAVRQLDLLLFRGEEADMQSDFYSYRYFASEGFLPGYSFPRLPLSAYLPGRRKRLSDDDDYLSRPRFLAISEFGPRSIIYHEGSRFEVIRAMLPVGPEERPLTQQAVQCDRCGYLHVLAGDTSPDLCEKCGAKLPAPFTNLFKMQNAATRRRERINSDEEERLRLGYEIKTGVRFSERSGRSSQLAVLRESDGGELASLEYGATATVWRLNLGRRRRRDKERLGHLLDLETGYWASKEQRAETDGERESPRIERVIPFVEDQRNCLLLRPAHSPDAETMASLQAALKSAIQVVFQLEDRELATEPLPDEANRRMILFYEAAEGGAGVLHRLVEDREALADVARQALEICHFAPDGEDLRRAPGTDEDCEAACYDCLMSYYNQRDHRLLDRLLLRDLLLGWAAASVDPSPTAEPRDDHLEKLLRLADSELEKKWLRLVERLGLRLPDHAQHFVEACNVCPDFFYRDYQVAVFVDGPPHDEPRQKQRDEEQQDALEDEGVTVLRFHHGDDWEELLRRNAGVFGKVRENRAQ